MTENERVLLLALVRQVGRDAARWHALSAADEVRFWQQFRALRAHVNGMAERRPGWAQARRNAPGATEA